MKKLFKIPAILVMSFIVIAACKKSNSEKQTGDSPISGFWTFKEDANNDYWNANVLFNNDGTFRMYTALSLDDTAAAQAVKDTANQVVTFGTYTVNGNDVEMEWQEFNIVGLKFSGTLNSSGNNIIGNIEDSNPNDAKPLWYLTKP
ncbi:MAG TPA: hypothetical protein VG890_04775 [Puia sp.]|nr:hypothetical protein [Puia sp.]